MPRLRVALITVAIIGVAAGCGSAGSTSASQPSAAPVPSASASSAPIAGASIAVAASASPATAPSIALTEWKVILTGTIKAGKTKVTIKDVGVAAHEFLVFKSDRDPSAYPVDKAGNIEEEGVGVTLISDGENIDPGGTQTRTIDLAPGTYLFVCNIPGHFKAGMFTIVTVTP